VNIVSKCRFSLYLNIRGLQTGAGKLFMGVLENPGKALDFLSVKEREPSFWHAVAVWYVDVVDRQGGADRQTDAVHGLAGPRSTRRQLGLPGLCRQSPPVSDRHGGTDGRTLQVDTVNYCISLYQRITYVLHLPPIQ